MRNFTLMIAFLVMFVAACSNPREGGTGDNGSNPNPGNQPEVSDTTIAVPDSVRNQGTTGYPGVNTVTGDTMTRYLEHTTGFSGSGTEEQIKKNGNGSNNSNQDNQKR